MNPSTRRPATVGPSPRSEPRPPTGRPDASDALMDLFHRLLGAFGPQEWWPGRAGPFEVCVGAILTQSAAWTNVEKALARMRSADVLSLDGLHRTPVDELAEVVRPSGYFNAKARKLKAFASHVYGLYDGDLGAMLARPLELLRPELLSIHGIGEETADDILCYAAHQPSFVVDAYTRRILSRMGLAPERDRYDAYRRLFMDALPVDVALYQEYHAALVRLGKDVCRKRVPRCGGCPLRDVCPTGRGGAPPRPL